MIKKVQELEQERVSVFGIMIHCEKELERERELVNHGIFIFIEENIEIQKYADDDLKRAGRVSLLEKEKKRSMQFRPSSQLRN